MDLFLSLSLFFPLFQTNERSTITNIYLEGVEFVSRVSFRIYSIWNLIFFNSIPDTVSRRKGKGDTFFLSLFVEDHLVRPGEESFYKGKCRLIKGKKCLNTKVSSTSLRMEGDMRKMCTREVFLFIYFFIHVAKSKSLRSRGQR